MKKLLFLLILQNFIVGKAYCQSFTINELITLANTPSKNIDHYLKKKGFTLSYSTSDSFRMTASFIPKIKGKNNSDPKKSIDISMKDNSKVFTLHTTALNEYEEGDQRLIKLGFFYDTLKDIRKEPSMLFRPVGRWLPNNDLLSNDGFG